MNILIVPMYSKQEINSDSNYVWYCALVRGMIRVRPTWRFVIVFPDAGSGFKYDDDGFWRLPNVTRVSQRMSTRKGGNATAYDPIWYDALMRQFGFDAVLCALPEIAGWIKHAGDNGYERASRPVTIIWHHFTIHETLPYPWNTIEHLAGAQAMGSTLGDWSVFQTRYARQMYVETARRWLREDIVDRVVRDSTLIAPGTLEPEIVPPRTYDDTRPPLILYNHRLQNYKNWAETFAVLDALAADGVPFRVRYTSTTHENIGKISDKSYVEIRLCATRAAYLAALKDGDLNTTNSQHETFCISAVESMAAGQPLVAPHGITFPEITHAEEIAYPFLFRSGAQQTAMLRTLLMDAPLRRAWGARLSHVVRRDYSQIVTAQQTAALIEQESAKSDPHTPEDARAFVAGQLATVPTTGMPIRAFYNLVAHQTVGDRIPFSSQSLTIIKMVRLVRAAGGSTRIEHGAQRIYAAAG